MKIDLKLINRNEEPIKYLCFSLSPYSLLLYLLYQPINIIKQTSFFSSQGVPKSIKEKLPNCVPFEDYIYTNKFQKYTYLFLMKHYLRKHFDFINKVKIYGVDGSELMISSILNGRKDMSVIEDGLAFYELDAWRLHNPWLTKIVYKIVNHIDYPYGHGSHCREVLYTGLKPIYIPNKIMTKINPEELWNENKEKQQFILDIFGFDYHDLDVFKGKDIILITQPFDELGKHTEKEKLAFYKKAIANYNPNRIIIKRHPREVTDYASSFPGITCFNKPIPLELLSFLGIRFKIAITYFSTAIYNFNYDLQRIIIKSE